MLAVPICNFVVMSAALATQVLMPFGAEGRALPLMGPGLEMMASVATWVAGLEGAVSRVPAIPAVSVALIAVRGLWLCLLRQHWRLLGLVAIALGVAVATLGVRLDLLVGGSGRLVVLRDVAGKFSGLTSRFSKYELSQWLARYGDRREVGEVRLNGAPKFDGVR